MQGARRRWLGLLGGTLLLALGRAWATEAIPPERVPYDTRLADALTLRIGQGGLDFFGRLLADGLEQPALKSEIVAALEGQEFRILLPNPGGYARIVVDYEPGSPQEELDGFRYDDVDVAISTIPFAGALRPENGVLYPALYLNHYYGSEISENTNQLPELHVRIYYPETNPNPIRAVAYGQLVATGILRPYIGAGSIRVAVEEFKVHIYDFEVAFVSTAGATPVVLQGLGDVLLSDWRKELEDALADVLMSGLNDILFDRDKDGEPDTLIDVNEALAGLNDTLGTDLRFDMEPRFQTNATLPTTVYLRLDGALVQRSLGACVGPDAEAGFWRTILEQDGLAGHDPPHLETVAPSGAEAQFAVALSDDFLNQILFNAYRTGLGCLWFDPLAPGVPTEVTQLLTTDNFGVIVGDWLGELFPSAPVGLRFRMLEAPVGSFPVSESVDVRLRLPAVAIDLLVHWEGRWLRLMQTLAHLDLGLGVEDLSLQRTPFAEFTFDFAVDNRVVFDEVARGHREELERLLPTALSLAEGMLADRIGGAPISVTDCLGTIDLSLFELGPLGIDPSGRYAHYLGAWLSLSGSVDLGKLLGECLIGESLVAPPAPRSARFPGVAPVPAALLAGAPVQRWRFEPGFVHRGSDLVPPVPAPGRTWWWQGADGGWRRVRLVPAVASTAPTSAPELAGGCGVSPRGVGWEPLLGLVLLVAVLRRRWR